MVRNLRPLEKLSWERNDVYFDFVKIVIRFLFFLMWYELLIDLVKKQPELYDRTMAGYRSLTKKKVKWKKISTEINDSLGTDITG